MSGRSDASGRASAIAGWVVLLSLDLALLIGALTFSPLRWPSVVGDEATYLSAAMSLAWDGDLEYTAKDLSRFRRLQGREPEGLILAIDHDSGRYSFSKPAGYPMFLAPFVRAAPKRGHAIANALALIAASVVTALALSPVLGGASTLWSASYVYASVFFAHVFWAHADLFLACLLAIGVSLLLRSARVVARSRRGRWEPVVGGLLMGAVVATRPVYAPILLVVPFLLPRWRERGLYAAGFGVLVLSAVLFNIGLHGTWSSYSGDRHGYYSEIGFPLDAQPEGGGRDAAPAPQQPTPVAASWTARWLPYSFDARLFGYNLFYLVFGRHVGLLPYMMPLLLGVLALRPRGASLAAIVAFCIIAAGFLVLRPFNFYGGGGALANRYLLPAYPLFWFLPAFSESSSRMWRFAGLRWWAPLGAAVLAAPFLWPLWTAPRGYLHDERGGYRYVARFAQRLLPHELSQSWLKPGGREDFVLDAGGVQLWVKPLSPAVVPLDTRTLRLQSTLGVPQLAIGTRTRIEELEVSLAREGADRGSGDWAYRVVNPFSRRAHHAMWWSEDPVYLYTLDLGAALEAARHRSPGSETTIDGDRGDVWLARLRVAQAAKAQRGGVQGHGSE